MRQGKKSRWDRELQRRLGTRQLWFMVSFTGKFQAKFLQRAVPPAPPPVTKALTRAAVQARDRLRWAQSLRRMQEKGRKRFTGHEMAGLHALAAGTLLKEANEATRASGRGRIRNEDGTFEDIAPHHGGIVRTLLDHVLPTEADDDDAESMY